MKRIKNILREPILLIILFGILLFWLYSSISSYYESKNKQIYVSTGQVELLKESFTKTWNRPPVESELEAQIENYIKDEVFYREAVKLGLDKTDPAVKRRLRQLMELMLDDNSRAYPSEDQLQTYLQDNPDKFQEDPRISFSHIYFATEDKQGAIELLPGLQDDSINGQDYTGSMIMIPDKFEDESQSSLNGIFGTEFSSAIFDLEAGNWQGPVASAYGWHLVQISKITPGLLPDLDDVWDQVEREWLFNQRQVRNEEQYEQMKDQYVIAIENPKE